MPDNPQPCQSPGIGLWRNVPRCHPVTAAKPAFPSRAIFPGARQALSYGLHRAGLSRPNRVAFPEWSSSCVVSALGKYVTPLPMREATEHKLKVEGILLYEQWGWGFPVAAWEQLAEKYRHAALILDRVDSGDFFYRTKLPVGGFRSVAQVLSLWKLFGLPGGGILLAESEYVEFERDTTSLSPITELLAGMPGIGDRFDYEEYFKNQTQMIHPAVTKWLEQNSLLGAAEDERQARHENTLHLCHSSLALGWPDWMREALAAGGAPGIAPVLRGADHAALLEAVGALEKAGVNATIYHFDWYGNPLSPNYEPCLALPVHGQMKDVESVIAILEKLLPD
jgi:hypothetical protein